MYLRCLLLFTFILCSTTTFSTEKGLVVAFAGLSGSGKTTMAKELEKICSCYVLTEAEESDWPDVITKKEEFGYFPMWMGFRQLWIPQQYEAQKLKKQHQLVIVDPYFIKVIGYELMEPGNEWLFPKEDVYFEVFNQICQLDIEHIPDPDCIVLFDISLEDWIKLLGSRTRAWDKTPGFVESYESTKLAIQKAVQLLCRERNIKLIHFKQEFGDADKQASRLKSLLLQNGLL